MMLRIIMLLCGLSVITYILHQAGITPTQIQTALQTAWTMVQQGVSTLVADIHSSLALHHG